MKILSIETSCDDTAIAVVEASGGLNRPVFTVLQNTVSSQIAIHQPFGGVVPNLAKREHQKNLPLLLQLIAKKKITAKSIDAIAVTVGPGLEPALWAGIEFAKQLAKDWQKSLIGANHMEGHLYSNWLTKSDKKQVTSDREIVFPAIALVVSGGHTILLKMDSLTKWKKLGETRDDAAGEAFDKIARLINLPYPGGPEIERLARAGNPKAIAFPRPMLKDKNYDFSFSGLKTSVLYYLRDIGFTDVVSFRPSLKRKKLLVQSDKFSVADVCASVQQAIVDVLVGKTIRAARQYGAQSVLLCGGVSANKYLQDNLKLKAKSLKLDFHCPTREYNTDNAAMIAAAAYIQKLRKKKLPIAADATLSL